MTASELFVRKALRTRHRPTPLNAAHLGIVVLLVFVGSAKAAAPVNVPHRLQPAVKSPVSAQESLSLLELADPRLKVELAAAEPQVLDPVAIAFDEKARMWVVEMGDYPNGPKPGQPPLSRIRLLEDRDGDGFYETAHDFRDHLLFATGIQPWRGGVIVTLSGRVVWMKDTDGDGKADVEETWFTGFSEQNPQLRANHPTFALDNRVYIANGLRGGNVIAHNTKWSAAAGPVSISGRDFSFDPLRGTYAAVSGIGQFGTAFDDFGNRFVCSNRNPCQHVVLSDADLARTPWAAVPSVMQDVSPAGNDSHVYPLTRAWTTSNLHAGQFTAACGVTIYRGGLLGDAYYGNSFTCEPTANLVHRDALEPDGATFRSRTADAGVDFLASRDEWFRPVNLANGPDGALYVVDMYRAVIEHPEWVPDELKHRADERYGDDRGRIYRIVPATFRREGSRHTRSPINAASTSELVALLDHPNSWHRETAARLLYERQDKSARGALERVALGATRGQGRALALYVLDGLSELSPGVVLKAMDDREAGVRGCAVRLGRRWLANDPEIRKRLLQLADNEPNARVRFEIALALGDVIGEPSAATALARVAIQDRADEWARRAAATSLGREGAVVFSQVIHALDSRATSSQDADATLVGELAEVAGATPGPSAGRDGFRSVERLIESAGRERPDPHQRALLLSGFNGLIRGVRRRGVSIDSKSIGISKEQLLRLEAVATQVAEQPDRPAERRDAIEVLRVTSDPLKVPAVLTRLATSEPDHSVRLAALAALSSFHDPSIGRTVLENFAAEIPPVRRAILDVLLSETGRTRQLLDELAARRIAVAELDPSRTMSLVHHRDADVRKRAQTLLAAAIPADRRKVIAEYQSSLTLVSDAKRGREVFAKNCTACHRIGDLGVSVAPDIGDSRTMTPAQILVDILDPNRKVDNNYFSYTAVTKEGKVYTGILATETTTSVTLRQQENKTVSLLRDQIEELHSNGVSLMPVGLEKNIDRQQMADLISFVKNWRYLDGQVPFSQSQAPAAR
jgi:putative membrane-bound dehydrogenase-like protein